MESDYNIIFVTIAFDVFLTIHYKTKFDNFLKIWKNVLIDA